MLINYFLTSECAELFFGLQSPFRKIAQAVGKLGRCTVQVLLV